MTRRDEIDNLALSRDARTFSLTFQIEEPGHDQVLYLDPDADFPFEIVRIAALCTVGSVEIQPQIDGAPVDTDQSDSSGVILVDQPSLIYAEPDGSLDICGQNQALTVQLFNPTSDAAQLVVKITCRRTEENVVVS